MPIYEYRCAQCDHAFERLVGMNDPNPACPACGQAEARKQFSTFASPTGGHRPAGCGLPAGTPPCQGCSA